MMLAHKLFLLFLLFSQIQFYRLNIAFTNIKATFSQYIQSFKKRNSLNQKRLRIISLINLLYKYDRVDKCTCICTNFGQVHRHNLAKCFDKSFSNVSNKENSCKRYLQLNTSYFLECLTFFLKPMFTKDSNQQLVCIMTV